MPHNLNLPHNASTLPHVSRRDSSASDSPSEPTKPVLRKHGKLITFFRSFILSRPARGKLKKSGILKERVFGCDLGEHLLNTGQDGEYEEEILECRRTGICRIKTLQCRILSLSIAKVLDYTLKTID